MFKIFPSDGLTPLPQLSDFSVWLVAEDRPPTTLLCQRAHQRRNEWATLHQPRKPDSSSFPGLLQHNAPVDAAAGLTAARQGDTAGEAQALTVAGPYFRQRMSDFRSRVWMQPPVSLASGVLCDFASLWSQYCGSLKLAAESFPLTWLHLDVEKYLTAWPSHPSWFSWSSRPTWIDPSEWAFLQCCYNPSVSPVDRLALFLLIYGALTVSQITRLFRALAQQTGWTFPLNEAGYTVGMDYLVKQWAAILRCMARAQVKQVPAG
jgi:hypothetical protein